MGKVSTLGQMEGHMMDSTLMTKNKALELISGQNRMESQVKSMRATGTMENSMGRVSSLTLEARAVSVFGLTEIVTHG